MRLPRAPMIDERIDERAMPKPQPRGRSPLALAVLVLVVASLACKGRERDGITSLPDELRDAGPKPTEGPIVVAGPPGTCVLLADRSARCVGAPPLGPSNEKAIEKLGPLVQIALGDAHACALDAAGKVRCWGSNERGQIGDGDPRYHDAPTLLRDLHDVVELSLAGDASCARVRDGHVLCWGNNYGRHLGCERAACATPTKIEGVEDAAQIALGTDHACARAGDGRVTCWGKNEYGQLGTGAATEHEGPSVVAGVSAIQIAVGDSFSCARTSDLRVLCWGKNYQEQLGVPPTTTLYSETPLVIEGARGAVDLAIYGTRSHACVLTRDGRVRCWGDSEHGELGNGAAAGRIAQPSDVVDASGRALDSIAQIAVGALHTCARTSLGKVLCWGDDTFGELGRGASTTPRFVMEPTAVAWW